MYSIFLDIASGMLPQNDWIWGVVGVVAGVFVEIAMNGKPQRARAKPNRRR
jgi:hypothetical protein